MKLFIFSGFFFFALNSQALLVEKIQAQVGEEMISLIDLKNFQKQIRLNLVPPSLLLKYVYSSKKLLKSKSKLLDFMITRSVLAQIAKQKQLPEIPKKNIQKVFLRLKGSSSHKKFSIKLKQAGLSVKTLKQEILIDLKNDLLLSQFVISKIAVSEQDIESYHFNKYHQALFKTFEYEFATLNFKENKKEAVLRLLKKDKDLVELKEVAEFLNLEHKVLKLKEGEIQKFFKKELDKLFVSQISSVLFVNNSYYILQLKWKTPQISTAEQKKKNQIQTILYEKKTRQEIEKWIEEKKTAFSIRKHSL